MHSCSHVPFGYIVICPIELTGGRGASTADAHGKFVLIVSSFTSIRYASSLYIRAGRLLNKFKREYKESQLEVNQNIRLKQGIDY